MDSASPFDLPVTELDIALDWSAPFTKRYPSMPLARLLRARLWRTLCAAGTGSDACASRAERLGQTPVCSKMQSCLAHAAYPLPGQARSHHMAAVSLTAVAKEPTQTLLHVRLLGHVGQALRKPVIEAQTAIAQDGLHSEPQRVTGICVLTAEREARLSERAKQLGVASAWRLRFLTPWVVAKSGREKDFRIDLPRFVQQLPGTIAQRAYKLAALDLADRRRGGELAPDGDAAHALCLRARDAAAAELASLEVDALHMSRLLWEERSASNAQAFALHCVMGDLRVSAPAGGAAVRCAAWLAMLEAFGGGEMTAEGFGSVHVEQARARGVQTEDAHE